MSILQHFWHQAGRTKLETIGAFSLFTLGLLTGLGTSSPNQFHKYVLSVLSGAGLAGCSVFIVQTLNNQEGTLCLEIASLNSQITELLSKVERLSQEKTSLQTIKTELEDQTKHLQLSHSTQQTKLQSLHAERDEWKQAAIRISRTARTLKTHLEDQQSTHQLALSTIQKQHGAHLHKQVKSRCHDISQRLYQNYSRKIDEEVAELTSQHEQEITLLKQSHDLQLVQYQSRISELNAEIEELTSQIDHLSQERDQLTDTLESLHSHDLPDIRATFEAEWTDNDRRLQQAIDDLQHRYTQGNPTRSLPRRDPRLAPRQQSDHLLPPGTPHRPRWPLD